MRERGTGAREKGLDVVSPHPGNKFWDLSSRLTGGVFKLKDLPWSKARSRPMKLRVLWKDQSGQSTVEFALVLPVLFLAFILFAQVALILHAKLAVAAAAREGARKGVETSNRKEVEEAARRAAVGLDRSRVSVKVEEEARKRGSWVRVEVEYAAPMIFPLVKNLLPEVVVRDRSEMRIENDRRS